MDQRTKIGLIFSYNPQWIAGTYYVQNLVHALATLPPAEQPHLVVLCEKESDFQYLQDQTSYLYLEKRLIRPISTFGRAINRISRALFMRNLWLSSTPTDDLSSIFPLLNYHTLLSGRVKHLYWIPDFQEAHLPHLFGFDEIKVRKETQWAMARSCNKLIFSSQDASADFHRLYPNARCQDFVMPFAVTLPNFQGVDVEQVRQNFHIKGMYFFCANQFWAHKNHIIVLEAISKLKSKGVEVQVLFSGKASDYRNKEYFDNLQKYIVDHNLVGSIHFLGFLDRDVQLALMRGAIAVVQPSLFEGWSTVVEDCKAIGQFIILSSLGVHKEQIAQNVEFFDPRSSDELALLLEKYQNIKPLVVPTNYIENIAIFSRKFIKITSL